MWNFSNISAILFLPLTTLNKKILNIFVPRAKYGKVLLSSEKIQIFEYHYVSKSPKSILRLFSYLLPYTLEEFSRAFLNKINISPVTHLWPSQLIPNECLYTTGVEAAVNTGMPTILRRITYLWVSLVKICVSLRTSVCIFGAHEKVFFF